MSTETSSPGTSPSPLQTLAINDVLDYAGKLVRLIAANPASNIAYVIELRDLESAPDVPFLKTALPVEMSFSELRAQGIRQEDPTWFSPFSPSKAVQEVRESRYSRIQELIRNPGILVSQTRGPLLVAHSKKVGVSKKTLLSDLRAWWQRGQVKDALLGDYHRSGRVTKDTPGAIVFDEESLQGIKHVVLAPVSICARGRRPIDGNYTPMPISEKEKTAILKLGRALYEKDCTVSMRSVVANVIAALYAFKAPDGSPAKNDQGNPVLPPLGRRPTSRQISYLLKRVLPTAKTYIRRHGAADYFNNRAPTTGTVFDDCIGPADVYECDDTTFDFHLVAESDITAILGKPTLHIVVDRYTRLITGFHLSLDASCWEDAKLALLSVSNDWKVLCGKHGVRYEPADFPAQGVICNRYFADRGPYMTFASDEMTNAGNDSTNAPARLSRSKPIVESTFRRVNKLISEVPGYEPQWNVNKRRRKPFEAYACLTRTQLEGIVLRAVITLNREILKEYPQSPADSSEGHLPIPREIWAREVDRLNTLPRRVSQEWLRRALLSKDVATVTQDGIRFLGNYYTCKEAVEKDWFSIASIGSNFDVEIRFTPKNLDEIWVQDPHQKDARYVAKLTTKSLCMTGESSGLTDTRSAEIAEQRRKLRRESETENSTQLTGFVQDITATVQAAQAKLAAATKGKSLASRKTDSLEMREAEATQHRKATHKVATEPFNTSAEAPAAVVPPPVEPLPTSAAVDDDVLPSLSDPDLMKQFFESLENT